VRRAAIVPQQQIAHAPDVPVDKIVFLGVLEHVVEQRLALGLRQVDDADGHEPVDVDGLAPGVLVGAKHRVHALGEGGGAAAVALLGRAVIVVVRRVAAFELAADRVIERVVGRVAAGEQGIAPRRRDLDRIKQRRLARHLGVDHVVVEHHLAVRQCPDRLAILADVGDQHDARQ
jgi:hypothetical protein